MICPSCGLENRGRARFCAHCGHSLVVPVVAPPAPDAALPVQDSVPATFGRSAVPLRVDRAAVWQRVVLVLASLPLLFVGVGSAFSFSPSLSWLFILAGGGCRVRVRCGTPSPDHASTNRGSSCMSSPFPDSCRHCRVRFLDFARIAVDRCGEARQWQCCACGNLFDLAEGPRVRSDRRAGGINTIGASE